MNPEFKRNLWLEVTPARLVTMPALLALIAGLNWLSMEGGVIEGASGTTNMPIDVFAVLGGVFLLLWGSSRVLGGIDSEILERTWDGQRLSALSPWQMAWGKLLGPTIQPWYGAVLCAAIVLFTAARAGQWQSVLIWIAAGMLSALTLHAGLLAQHVYTLDPQKASRHGTLARVMILFFVVMLLVQPLLFLATESGSFNWWGLGLPLRTEALLLSALAAALALLALWRAMCRTLLMRTTPWAWLVGCAVLAFILAGMPPVRAVPGGWALVLAGVALVASYFALYLERNSRLDWEALFYHLRRARLRRVAEILPLWLPSLLLAGVAILLFLLFHADALKKETGVLLSTLLGFAWLRTLRDCGIFLFFAWSPKVRRPFMATVLTLFVLSLLLPGVLANGVVAAVLWLEPFYLAAPAALHAETLEATSTFGPSPWWLSLAHLVIVLLLLLWRWYGGRRR